MRLSSLKISGFKSFADPVHLLFQSNLTAIVGPNGCGKSNIVDAVHCVLGSTSKNLRAEMIADVIFNGTTTRKPVGQAAIELVFENTEGRIGGEYANYPEIAIRRELNREGQSAYFINSGRCRRKDIVDIFLGTGLGQNSYAIIGQGMIARLIEAKPEELRGYLEEAAGTSKYKERRRETEIRIKHTQENLLRLNDIREEQLKQLNHLQRQANSAERFKILKAAQRLLRAQLQGMIWREMNEQMIETEKLISTQETLLEAKHAESTQLQKRIEITRVTRQENSEVVSTLQANYYEYGAGIKEIDNRIKHIKERLKQLEEDKEKNIRDLQELDQQLSMDQDKIQTFLTQIASLELNFEEMKSQATEKQEQLSVAEKNMHLWQEQWDEFNQVSAQTRQQVELEKTKIQHLEQRQQSLLQRIARVRDEEAKQNPAEVSAVIQELTDQRNVSEHKLADLQKQLDALQEHIRIHKNLSLEANQEIERLAKAIREKQASFASLEALQKVALGKDDDKRNDWLKENELSQQERLAETLDVEPGWELAVETVLAAHLDAVSIDNFSSIKEPIFNLQGIDVTFFKKCSEMTDKQTVDAHASQYLLPLGNKIHTSWSVAPFIQHVFVAENLEEALSHLSSLSRQDSIVTRDGIWLSQSWLKISRAHHQTTGVIQREHEIKDLQQKMITEQKKFQQKEIEFQNIQEKLSCFLEEREGLQQKFQHTKAKTSELIAQIQTKEAFLQHLKEKQVSLNQEILENDKELDGIESALTSAKAHLENMSHQALEQTEKRKNYLTDKDSLTSRLSIERQVAASSKQQVNENQMRLDSLRSQERLVTENMNRVIKQKGSSQEKKESIQKLLTETFEPLSTLEIELQSKLEKRVALEHDLQQAKDFLSRTDNELMAFEKERQQLEDKAKEIRTLLETRRLSAESLKVHRENHRQNIEDSGFVFDDFLQELNPTLRKSVLEEDLEKNENKIIRLGAINLAAIDEFATLSERKEFLDRQHDDLTEALSTLENAIRKIDKETRVRFKETYIKLNDFFKNFFEQIFGGGDAYLELTSDDLLETGIIVKAQPPGKKNSTINLLSGGEKALTAIALVFAIFSLNPAPFCILDEVDAPLDDINVGRFCSLVKKMSEKIQFIFISHNKITIEMGQQLAGVTMQEPGVSRLVSVDIEQAISMAIPHFMG